MIQITFSNTSKAILASSVAIVLAMLLQATYAHAMFGSTPFGGRMLSTYSCASQCPSSGCRLVSIGSPKGGSFMYCQGLRLYAYYMAQPMRWQLGLAGESRACHKYVCVGTYCYCQVVGSGLQVRMVGTSRY